MNYQPERWAELRAAITTRMAQLGYSKTELDREVGMSAETVRPIRTGTPGNYRASTLAKVSKALGWTPESIEQILEGGEPTPIGGLGPLEPQGRSVDLGSAAVTLRPTYAEVLARLEAVEQALAELRDRQLDDPSAPAQP